MKDLRYLLLSGLILISFVGNSMANYHPEEGRWISRDPIEEAGGLNLYAFSDNAPSLAFDYLGLLTINNSPEKVHASFEIKDPGNGMDYIFNLDPPTKWPPPSTHTPHGGFDASITDTLTSIAGTSSLKFYPEGNEAAMSAFVVGNFVIDGCCPSKKMTVTTTATSETLGSIPRLSSDNSYADIGHVRARGNSRFSLTYTTTSPEDGSVLIPYQVKIGWRDTKANDVAFGLARVEIAAACIQ